MKEKDYRNPVTEYDPRAIEAWRVADMLTLELESASSLDHWNGYGEGYGTLKDAVKLAIERLRKVY